MRAVRRQLKRWAGGRHGEVLSLFCGARAKKWSAHSCTAAPASQRLPAHLAHRRPPGCLSAARPPHPPTPPLARWAACRGIKTKRPTLMLQCAARQRNLPAEPTATGSSMACSVSCTSSARIAICTHPPTHLRWPCCVSWWLPNARRSKLPVLLLASPPALPLLLRPRPSSLPASVRRLPLSPSGPSSASSLMVGCRAGRVVGWEEADSNEPVQK